MSYSQFRHYSTTFLWSDGRPIIGGRWSLVLPCWRKVVSRSCRRVLSPLLRNLPGSKTCQVNWCFCESWRLCDASSRTLFVRVAPLRPEEPEVELRSTVLTFVVVVPYRSSIVLSSSLQRCLDSDAKLEYPRTI